MRQFKSLGGYPLWGLVLLCALTVAVPAHGDNLAVACVADVAPPNPRLYARIARGEIRVPTAMTDQSSARNARASARPRALTGTVKVLAALVDFADKPQTVAASYFDTLLFAPPNESGRGSIRDYFTEISYGQVEIATLNQPSGVGWLRAPSNYAYYVNGANCLSGAYPQNCQKLAEEIVDALHTAGVNFANYDNDLDGYAEPVVLIHAGTGAEANGNPNDMWSHSGGLRNPRTYDGVMIDQYVIVPEYWQESPTTPVVDMTIGILAHEMGHGFWNLVDLYDTDNSSRGIGNWSLMSTGAWNGPERWGESPAWPDAWSRIRMGTATPTLMTSDSANKVIPQAYNNPSAQTVLKLRSAVLNSQEYFLVENRQPVPGSYDEYLPGNGLLIWHVDEAMTSNRNECTVEPISLCAAQHYRVALQQADGLLHLEKKVNGGDAGDPFPGNTANRNWTMWTNPSSSSWYGTTASCIGVTNISDSGASMSADIQVMCRLLLPFVSRTP